MRRTATAMRKIGTRDPDPSGEQGIVVTGDHVDRGPHQGPLNDAATLEGLRQLVALEPGDTRPEPDVSRGRILRLQTTHALECPRERKVDALEQQLPPQERPVQLPLGQRGFKQWLIRADPRDLARHTYPTGRRASISEGDAGNKGAGLTLRTGK